MPDQTHGDGEGDEAEFSPPERIALVIGGISTQLSLKLGEARDLMAAANRLDGEKSSRPAELQHLARHLNKEARGRAERAAEEAANDVASCLQQLLPGGEVETASNRGGTNHYPLAPEQLFLIAMIGIGPERLRQVVENFIQKCGDVSDTLDYALRYMQWMGREPMSTILGRALLPIVIADFEQFLAALVRLWITLYPEANGVGRHQLPVSVIEKYESIDDIRRLAIERRVDEFMKLNCDGWREKLADKLHIRLDDLISDWPEVVEMFSRRHVIIHAGGSVDERYLSALPSVARSSPHGTTLCTDRAYISAAIDRIEQLADSLVVAWLEHFLPPGDPRVPEMTSAPVLRALEKQRWHDAANLAAIALKKLKPDHPYHELRVNSWMARRELGCEWEALRDEIEAWVPPGGEPGLLVAKAALLWDEPALLVALREYESTGLSVKQLRTWPLLMQMRKRSPRVAAVLDRGSATPSGQRTQPPRHPKRR